MGRRKTAFRINIEDGILPEAPELPADATEFHRLAVAVGASCLKSRLYHTEHYRAAQSWAVDLVERLGVDDTDVLNVPASMKLDMGGGGWFVRYAPQNLNLKTGVGCAHDLDDRWLEGAWVAGLLLAQLVSQHDYGSFVQDELRLCPWTLLGIVANRVAILHQPVPQNGFTAFPETCRGTSPEAVEHNTELIREKAKRIAPAIGVEEKPYATLYPRDVGAWFTHQDGRWQLHITANTTVAAIGNLFMEKVEKAAREIVPDFDVKAHISNQ